MSEPRAVLLGTIPSPSAPVVLDFNFALLDGCAARTKDEDALGSRVRAEVDDD